MPGAYYRECIAQSVQGGGGFNPASVVDGWLRNDTAAGANAMTSWTNQLSSNHATQSDASRKPTSNADESVQWVEAVDSMGWPLDAANNGNATLAFAFWLDPDAIGVAQNIILGWGGTDGTVGEKWDLFLHADGSIRVLVFDALGGFNARELRSAGGVITAAPQFVTVEMDVNYGTEATRFIITRNLSLVPLTGSSIGTPTLPLTALRTVTGKLIVGNGHNAGASTVSPFAGRFGKNMYSRSSSGRMAGATEGLWTAAARSNLMNVSPLV